MRLAVQITMLVVLLCDFAVAQQSPTTSCPAISVWGPASLPDLKKPIPFTALLSEDAKKFPVTFKWKAHNGEIVDGQGTREVRVSWECGINLTTEVEVTGLPEWCNGKASDTFGIADCGGALEPVLLDELAAPAKGLSKFRRDAIKKAVDENPQVLVLVFIRHRENESAATIRKRKKQIIEWLAPADISRYTFREVPGAIRKTQFWLVPPGAEIPPD